MEILTLEQSDYYKTCIFRTRFNKKLFFDALPNLFSLKEALVIGEKFQMKSRTISKVLSASIPYLITQPAYGLYEKIQVHSDDKIIKSYKIPETRKIKKPESMKTVNFYSVEEIMIMKTDIATGQPIRQIARRLSKQFDRPLPGLKQKLYALKKTVPVIHKWNGPTLKKTAVKKVISTPVVEQQPAEIGVEVPHGMTFEGTPKKIMLHSDHFRIYF